MNKTITFTIEGIRPLVMHNGRLADPLCTHTKALKKAVEKKSKMTDADHEHARKCEWNGGVYWSQESGFFIPSMNIEACIVEGAKKSRKGKQALAAVMIDQDELPIILRDTDLKSKDPDKFRDDPDCRYQLRCGVKVQRSRVIRTRPMLPRGWKLEVPVNYDDTVMNREEIIDAVEMAGMYVGLGDWRPKFGRFLITAIDGKGVAK